MTVKNIVFGAGLVTALATSGSQAAAHPFDSQDSPSGRVLLAQGMGSHLGVMVEDTTTGVRVGEVTSGSAAAKAGVKEGDIIVDFDGERVRSARQLTRLIQETADGKSVKMTVTRNGQKQTLDATPDQRQRGFSFNTNRDDRIPELQNRLREFRTNPPEMNFFYRGEPRGDFFENFVPSSRGRLGVQVQTLSEQLQDYFGAKEGGALVSSVTKD